MRSCILIPMPIICSDWMIYGPFLHASKVRFRVTAVQKPPLEFATFFDYVFQLQHLGYGIPQIQLIEFTGPFDVFGNEIVPVHVIHGKTEVFGFRIGKFAYVTDCKKIPVTSMAMLEGLEVLVLGALRWEPEHWIHMTIPESLDVVDELRPKQTYLTHMMHTVEHTETNRKLPQNVQLAYDGLVVEV